MAGLSVLFRDQWVDANSLVCFQPSYWHGPVFSFIRYRSLAAFAHPTRRAPVMVA